MTVGGFATDGRDKRRAEQNRAHEKRDSLDIAALRFVDLLFSHFTKHFGVPFVWAFDERAIYHWGFLSLRKSSIVLSFLPALGDLHPEEKRNAGPNNRAPVKSAIRLRSRLFDSST